MATTISGQPLVVSSSKKFWLNARDFIKALAVAALSAPVTAVLTSVSAGKLSINLTDTWHLAVVSGAAYLLKNFLTPSQTTITGVTPGASTMVKIPPPGSSIKGPSVDQGFQ